MIKYYAEEQKKILLTMSRHHVVISEAVAVGLQMILLPCFNHETGEF